MAPRFLPSLGGGRRRVETSAMSGAGAQKALLERYFADLHTASREWQRDGGWTVEQAVREGYSRVVWVFRSVEAIAGNSSRLPYRLREHGTVLEDHPSYRVLNKKANPLETGRVFRKRLSAQVLLSPRGAFVETTRSRRGDLLRADLLPPGRTRPVPGTGADVISHFEVAPARYGQQPRRVEVENVRWVREAHPVDPYGAVTPLEALGLSIELDHFARLYNASFMRNDGRPGGILGIKGDIEDAEMDRVEAKFGGGPMDAGRLSVIAGDLDYVDVAKTPRDAQYVQSSNISKTEILVGFGVPESVVGNASGKTFANAEAEEYGFWTTTMVSHNDIIVSAFDEDSEDDLDGFLDTSKVEVLQRPEVARREEARREVSEGLRSILSYAQLAGIEDVESTPQTRALWLSGGKVAVATSAADVEALAAAAPGAAPPAPAPEGGVAAEDAAQQGGPGGGGGFMLPPTRSAAPPRPAALPAGSAQEVPPGTPPADGQDGNVLPFMQPGAKGLPRFRIAEPLPGETPQQAVARVVRESKAAFADDDDGPVSRVDPQWREAAETAIASRLEAVAERMTGVVQARLRSQKARKGTRHWQPDTGLPVDTRVGLKALDGPRIVDAAQWRQETREALEPLLADLAREAAALLVRDLGLDPDGEEAKALGRALARLVPARALPAVLAAAEAALRLVERSAERQAGLIADLIGEKENDGATLADIVTAVREFGARQVEWARGLAVQTTTATVEGARDAIVEHYRDPDIVKRWRTQRDDKVRPSHVKADGQEQGLGEPFEVGVSLLRFPGDPDAPLTETANCRCFLVYRSRSTGQFRRRPKGERDRKVLLPGIGEVTVVDGKHLPGRHDQGSHGNQYRAKPDAVPLPSGRYRKADRELVRKGRARLYGVTPPPLRGRGDTAEEREVVDSAEDAERHAALEALFDEWTEMPPDVTPADVESWRQEWVEEYPELDPLDDPELLAALDDEFIANWAAEWHERPWEMDDERADADPVVAERIRLAREAEQQRQKQPAEPPAPAEPVDEWEQAWAQDAEPVLPGDSVRERRQRAQKRPKHTAEQAAREEYELYLQSHYVAAVAATRGNIFSQAGKVAGVPDDVLFRGRLPVKYASEELLAWWAAGNDRITWTQFRARMLGRDSDLRRVRGRQQQYGEFG